MYDITIIGCGVVGASLAYALSKYNLHVLMLERENDVSMGTTKANSAIIHAGYDPQHGTLMAKLNIRGANMMEDLCRDLDVLYQRVGSLVLAFNDLEMQTIQVLYDNGVKNGVSGLEILSRDALHLVEPNVSDQAIGALFAPSAAIIEPWGLCLAQAEVAVQNGVTLWLNTSVVDITNAQDHLTLQTTRGEVLTRYAVNCCGTHAHEIAQMAGDSIEAKPTRGEYYLLDKSSCADVNHIIFQCPNEHGKGILIAPTVHGNLIVGPNSTPAQDADDTRTTCAGLEEVAATARKSIPHIDLRDCIRTFAGVRAITEHNDFMIAWSESSPKLLHLAGIKSPGLTAAPAIAQYTTELLANTDLQFVPRPDFHGNRRVHRFRHMTDEQKASYIAKNPLYGRVICRCETITEGEIVDTLHSAIPPCSLDGVKRRTAAGSGRCQGGFCGPRVMEIIARELGIQNVLQDQTGSEIVWIDPKGQR